MSIYRRFAKNVGIVAVSEIVMKLKPILFLPIITNALGASDYGVYTSIFVTVAFLTTFSTLGVDNGFVRFLAAEKDKEKVSSGFSSSSVVIFGLSCVVALAMFIFAGTLANTVFGSPDRIAAIQAGSFYLPLSALFSITLNFFLIRQKMLTLSLFRILSTFLPISLATIFILQGHGLFAVILAIVAVQGALDLAALLVITRSIGVRMPKVSVVWPYMKFGIPLIAGGVAGVVLNIGDRYVIGALMGAASVGVYSVAYTLGSAIALILSPINTALLAPVTKSHDEGRSHEVNKYLYYSVRYYLMLSIPAAVGVSILSASLISSLSTAEFLSGSFGVTAIIAVSTVFYGLFSIYAYGFYLAKKIKNTVLLMVVAGAANIGLNLLLVPIMGLVGASLATLICFFALFAACVVMTRRYISIPLDYTFFAKCVVAALLMGALVYYLKPAGWMQIIGSVAVGTLAYFGLLIAFRAFKKNELAFFKNFLKLQGTAID